MPPGRTNRILGARSYTWDDFGREVWPDAPIAQLRTDFFRTDRHPAALTVRLATHECSDAQSPSAGSTSTSNGPAYAGVLALRLANAACMRRAQPELREPRFVVICLRMRRARPQFSWRIELSRR